MNLVLPCFPLVGAVMGSIWYGVATVLVSIGVHTMLAAVLVSVTPFALSGLIHLDGYIDTSDALLSGRPLEEKIRILKDPHGGAFSSVMTGMLLLTQFAGVYAILDRKVRLGVLILIPILSRCCAALALMCLKTMPSSQYGPMFTKGTGKIHRMFVVGIAIITLVLSYLFLGPVAVAVLLSAIAAYAGAAIWTYRVFEGFSGDLTGFALEISELSALVVMGVL